MTRPARDTASVQRAIFTIRHVVVSDHTVDHDTPPDWWVLGTIRRDARGRQNPRMVLADWLLLVCNDPQCLGRVDVRRSVIDMVASVALRQHARDVQSRAAARRAARTGTPAGGDV